MQEPYFSIISLFLSVIGKMYSATATIGNSLGAQDDKEGIN